MTRLERKMAELAAAGKKGLIVYVTAGAPDEETSVRAIVEAAKAGADVIEFGLPFSDPMADGPVIQAAAVKALRGGMNSARELELLKEIRKQTDVPIVGMGYANPIHHYGYGKFVRDFKAAGMDGVIVPDMPHEESAELREIAAKEDFHVVEFVAPGTSPERMRETCADAKGFIYCVSNNGVTGEKKIDYAPIGRVCETARAFTKTPLAVGFGIGSPEAAVAAAAHADAVIVGSAVVRRLLDGKFDEAIRFIRSLRAALDAMQK